MKNVLLIINIILICLVAYLYYLHFHSVAKIETHAAQNNLQGKTNNSFQVAYIDLDSLQNNYGYYKKVKAEFERKQAAANNEIGGMQKKISNPCYSVAAKRSKHEPAGAGGSYARD
jgi:outer membrane protein